ncbi:MAG: efflux RND transporter periplasmic adaptor subunit [Myxococcota bacterium]|jgi:cobalt-zinc-cadmium efflux system membrane fusion protein|nr:efflux RND transporter periplasmic adaptor subunit [Myxococcota bacterium]
MKTRQWILMGAGLFLCACSSAKNSDPPKAEAHAEHGHEHGHAEESPERSDLDRPVKELLDAPCEHGIKAFECEECRYEVGVVRVQGTLLEGGLVKTATAQMEKAAVPVELTGEVRFDDRRVGHLSSQVEGIIKRVHVVLGDKVAAGQPLVEIESVTVGEAQVTHLEAQAMLELEKRNFERASALRKENISSEKEYLASQQQLTTAQIKASGAMGRLQRLGTGGDTRGRLAIRAPIDGTVLVMHAVPGEVAQSDEPLLTIGDNTSVWVWADLYERDIAPVKLGQAQAPLPASISVKAYPGEEFPGVVDLVSPAMDESSRTVKLRIAVPNSEGRLLAGMFASVRVFLPSKHEVLAVPSEAVLEDEGRSFVFIHHHDDFYLRRPVKVGRAWAGLVEIAQGLEPGVTVVSRGAFLLKSDVLRSKMGAGCAD